MESRVKKAVEEQILMDVEEIRKLPLESEARKNVTANIVRMCEVLNTADQIDEKWVDNAERRAADKEKAKEANAVELKKSKLTAGKVALELTKVGVPLAISTWLYLKVWKGNLKFEETGRFCANTTRELKLPKVFK